LIVDVHQHVWPSALIDGLRARSAPPRLRGWTLELSGEPDYEVDPRDHDPDLRAERARRDGLDLALVSLSSPLGIELLEGAEGAELLEAYHEGALSLPPPFRAWAAAGLAVIDPDALADRLDDGFVGLELPATALLDEPAYRRVGPLLDVLAERGRPLFVHPGPAAPAPVGVPPLAPWWPAVVDYVQQMHAAWFAFRLYGRPAHPRLRVCFAMLAGLAPLHVERFAARSGQRSVVDQLAYLEISSYGTRAVDAVVRVLGIDVLVNGSDLPYAEPVAPELGEAALSALRSANPIRLIDLEEVSDGVAVPAGAQS
jgi:6-methylsalicylate decarboxylase